MYGVQPDFISWIDSYLTNRKQAVWIDHTLSNWQDVPVGVPQGSILGPLLFTIFSNDLPEFLSCEIDQYADDSTLSCAKSAAGEITSELNSNLCEVSKWMQSNKMCLNVDKTHLMLAGTNHRILRTNAEETLDIRIDQVQLQPSVTNCERVLGVVVQPNLKWIEHANDLQGKLKFRLAGLRKVTHALDYEKRKVVAKAIFESVLTYCIPVWAGTSKGVIEDLQVLQNRAAQFVLKLPGRSNREHMFNTLGWLTVHQLSVFHTILTVYNIRRTKEPEYLADKLTRENVRGNIVVANTGLTLLKKSFVFRGAELWNKVPHSVRGIQNVKKFKKQLHNWVLEYIDKFM